ncbi:hypothetical protein NUL63_004565 [Salmonella enterica]|nr:hypothetical protein [Salmonella enterica]
MYCLQAPEMPQPKEKSLNPLPVQHLAKYAQEVLLRNASGFPQLRRQGHQGLPALGAVVLAVREGYGAAPVRPYARPDRRERAIQPRKLQVG